MKPQRKDRYIELKGVRVNNLKNVHLKMKTGQLTVVTGLSGSGKSSLVFDTLFAEGQRRYIESLSAYARQFLGKMTKPEVDFIDGIAPAIAIEQKTVSRNPRSTVGTVTEIYEYFKLLFAKIGRIYSPVSGCEVKRHSVANVCDIVLGWEVPCKIYILSPFLLKSGLDWQQQLKLYKQMGFSRLFIDQEIVPIDEVETANLEGKSVFLLIDRLNLKEKNKEVYARLFDSIQTAFREGQGRCSVSVDFQQEFSRYDFSNVLEADGKGFVKPSVNFFSFNNPYGACKTCEGIGMVLGISEDLVVPNPHYSVYDDAVACWRGEKMSEWKRAFIQEADRYGFPIFTPYKDLTESQKNLLWYGKGRVKGIYEFFKFVESQSYKIQYRIMLAKYRGRTLCPTCHGSRLREDALYVRIGGKNINDLVSMPVEEVLKFFNELQLTDYEASVSERILLEIKQRLGFLMKVGLPYLTLNRPAYTLSGGEAQRLHLSKALGSALVGSMYILDEPSIGLHPRDTHQLIGVLKQLRDLGNTVIVVEHDEDIMLNADEIVDIGPFSGTLGGEIVFQGPPREMIEKSQGLTAQYLRGELEIGKEGGARALPFKICLEGACQNNLQNVDVEFPLEALTVVTGVSGSGKTSLIKHTLYPALLKELGNGGEEQGKFKKLSGDVKRLKAVEMIDQNPLGRSSRSNPSTYVKAFDDIRNIFAAQPLAKKRGYKPGFFSFNVEGGRCEHCQGEGNIKVEMQFLADVYLPCEECGGKKYKAEVLDITYQGKTIVDVLEMTVDEAIVFFSQDTSALAQQVVEKIRCLQQVGLGYLKMGQSSNSLSGGEAQRVKLAYFLGKGAACPSTLFIFDEPTTGLHFHDIKYLMTAIHALIKKGHTVIVIEHQLDVIKMADWVIDLGPEGGDKGGRLLYQGHPEGLVHIEESYTAKFLKPKMKEKCSA